MSDHVPCIKRERRLWWVIIALFVSNVITIFYLQGRVAERDNALRGARRENATILQWWTEASRSPTVRHD